MDIGLGLCILYVNAEHDNQNVIPKDNEYINEYVNEYGNEYVNKLTCQTFIG